MEYTGVMLFEVAGLVCVAGMVAGVLAACRRRRGDPRPGAGRSVLVTTADTHLGAQVTLRLVSLGYRVFAGVRGGEPAEAVAARVLKAKLKALEAEESCPESPLGTLILVSLDVTREDSLHDAVDAVRRHLPVGENGLWAVVNTSGGAVKGRLELQESSQWEAMFKLNVIGTLRTARAFLPLLKSTRGRLVTLGLSGECERGGSGAVAAAAARHAVVGASRALAQEVAHLGVSVVPLHTGPISADTLFRRILVRPIDEEGVTMSEVYLRCCVDAVSPHAISVLEQALTDDPPLESYSLAPPRGPGAWLGRCATRPRPPSKSLRVQSV